MNIMSKFQLINRDLIYYVVKDETVMEYEKYTAELHEELNKFIPTVYNGISIYYYVCNISLALTATQSGVFLDETKRMHNAVSYFQFEQIENNKIIRSFIENLGGTTRDHFICAFFLTIETLNWTMELLKKLNKQFLLEPYLYPNMNIGIKKDVEMSIENQKLQREFLYEIQQELLISDSLYKGYERALQQAKNYIIQTTIK